MKWNIPFVTTTCSKFPKLKKRLADQKLRSKDKNKCKGAKL